MALHTKTHTLEQWARLRVGVDGSAEVTHLHTSGLDPSPSSYTHTHIQPPPGLKVLLQVSSCGGGTRRMQQDALQRKRSVGFTEEATTCVVKLPQVSEDSAIGIHQWQVSLFKKKLKSIPYGKVHNFISNIYFKFSYKFNYHQKYKMKYIWNIINIFKYILMNSQL